MIAQSLQSGPKVFVAINCHPFHELDKVSSGIASCVEALSAFRMRADRYVQITLFWHRADKINPHIKTMCTAAGFQIHHLPHHSNGQNLNAQIEQALCEEHDIFFRVDADDTVTVERFVLQSEALASNSCDICGAGLMYYNMSGQSQKVLPRETPLPRDYIENRHTLHPTMAFRLKALSQKGLRYRHCRLEDKAFILDAARLGLRFRNLQILAGGYHVGPTARRALQVKMQGFYLNLAFSWHQKSILLVIYACLMICFQILFGSKFLRYIRNLIHSPVTSSNSVKS